MNCYMSLYSLQSRYLATREVFDFFFLLRGSDRFNCNTHVDDDRSYSRPEKKDIPVGMPSALEPLPKPLITVPDAKYGNALLSITFVHSTLIDTIPQISLEKAVEIN